MSFFNQNNGINKSSKERHKHKHSQSTVWNLVLIGIISIVAALIVTLGQTPITGNWKLGIQINGLVWFIILFVGNNTYKDTHGSKRN